ncbi:hypothetical protein RDWZM_004069 [Blomia tropicalis]|uniref:Ecdysone receptor n=1 Tax=Blomia tropicalis TaxID=40697 RepID=A0A9Q0MGS4_BLOTA|nr:hypothetical protein RDWZM_004069 [Blomia tropicalis]
MSTSLVMMDTGVHRRSALNNSSTIVGDLKSTLVSNVPINFARKFLANNNINNNQQHHSVTAAHTPSVSIKLEPRVPSPCPADLAATVRGDISCQLSSATGKDLPFYLANKTATITEEQLHQHLLVKGTMNSVDANIVGNVATALSIKQRRSADDSYMASGQTILPNSTSARSPSPPPLLPNGHYYSQSPTTTNTTITTTNNNHHHHHNNTNSPFTGTLSGQMLKRDHDDAFGPSSTTTTSVTINISSSNNNSLASLPSSTNSPSPPPLMTNGHHSAVVNSLLVNGGNIASPTSSSFSDFGSTGQNRAEKAVDDLFDGVTIGSSGIRATKSHNHNSTSSSSSSSCSVSEQTSLVNDTISNTISNDLSSNTVSNYTNNNKKSRAIFGDDLLTIDGVRFETNSATTTATTTTVVDPMYPSTVVKIKRENDTMPSSRSHLSQSGTITMPLMTSTNIDTMGQSTTTTTPITNGLNGVQAQQQQQQQQPIARKRTAYQAALAGVTVVASSTSTNLSNVTNSGLLSDGLPEVSSSQNCTGISPVPSLESSEIDLELWDLDIHESSTSQSSGKEDMSPSNSVSGYVDSLGGDPKKKKGPAPRQQEELCLVCGDRASGYHYNALTCEGCKGFFRRSITKNAVYQCKYGNNCEIDMYMRRKCQECRLKKCLSVGMRPECVVPEYQCAIKREAKRAIKDKDKPNSTTKDGHLSPGTPQMINDDKQPSTPQMQTNWCTQNGTEVVENSNKKLSPHQESVIKKLVYYQEEFESPSEDDIKKIAPFPQGEKEDDNQKRLQHITEMTILTVQLIVEFSKRVPCFDKLFREDQITLLKACSSEVMMLRCSRKYDIRTDSIVYANNQPYTRDNYSSASISYVAESLFNFCRRMCVLKVDNAEYALLTAIVIFSDRPQLVEPRKVESIQEQYIETLRDYVEAKRPMNNCHFAKLLGILTELRTLGNINSEMCVSLKVQNKKLPPFLAEIWDIQEF